MFGVFFWLLLILIMLAHSLVLFRFEDHFPEKPLIIANYIVQIVILLIVSIGIAMGVTEVSGSSFFSANTIDKIHICLIFYLIAFIDSLISARQIHNGSRR